MTDASVNIDTTTADLYFEGEAHTIGTGWRKVEITKLRGGRTRVVNAATKTGKTFTNKEWADFDLAARSAKRIASAAEAAKREADKTRLRVLDGTKQPKQPLSRVIERALIVPEAQALAIDLDKVAAAVRKITGEVPVSAMPEQKDLPQVQPHLPQVPKADMKGVKVTKAPTAPTSLPRATLAGKDGSGATKGAPKAPASPAASIGQVDASKGALHEAKLIMIANGPTISPDSIVEQMGKTGSGLSIKRVTAATARSDFLHSVRALQEAGFLKDLWK